MPAADLDRRIDARIGRLDWDRARAELDDEGWSRLGVVLTASEQRGLIATYRDAARFRSTVDMARHRFGRGEYRYFANPLPPVTTTRITRPPALPCRPLEWRGSSR